MISLSPLKKWSFTSSTSWVCPAKTKRAIIEGAGGGGGGAGSAASTTAVGGGGAGSLPLMCEAELVPGDTYYIEIGAGGAGGAAGNPGVAGSNSYFMHGQTVTMTIASPCVVTLNSHGYTTGQRVKFITTGALPTGLTAGTFYRVVKINANTFNLLIDSGSNFNTFTKINTTGSQSGVHTIKGVLATFYGAPGGTTAAGGATGSTDSTNPAYFTRGGTPDGLTGNACSAAVYGENSQYAVGGWPVDSGGTRSGGGGGASFGPGGVGDNNTPTATNAFAVGGIGAGGGGGGNQGTQNPGFAGGSGQINIYAVVP